MKNVRERFHEAIDLFYETNHYLAGQVSRLGYPTMVQARLSMAGVLWDEHRKKIEFLFNEGFCDSLNDEEFNFVVAHEAGHVIYGHVFFLKTEIDAIKGGTNDPKEIDTLKRRFNIAADCVINDSLVNLYGLPRQEFLNKDGECSILYGKKTVGCDCHELSVTDVMKLLPEGTGEAEGNDTHATWSSFFGESGEINRDFVDAIQDFFEENSQNSAVSDQGSEDLYKLKESLIDCSDGYAHQAGISGTGVSRTIQRQQASLKWERIYFKKTENKKLEDSWSRRSRKLAGFPDDFILPSNRNREVEDVFVAIDVSASIDFTALELFVSLVKSLPRYFNVTAITFNTVCRPFDIASDKVRSGGGTSFGIIEKYIKNNLKKYPKAIFVLTDGEGDRIQPKHPNRWSWLLYSSCTTSYCKGMSYYKIRDLLK